MPLRGTNPVFRNFGHMFATTQALIVPEVSRFLSSQVANQANGTERLLTSLVLQKLGQAVSTVGWIWGQDMGFNVELECNNASLKSRNEGREKCSYLSTRLVFVVLDCNVAS